MASGTISIIVMVPLRSYPQLEPLVTGVEGTYPQVIHKLSTIDRFVSELTSLSVN